jgi:hypothetical protein
MGMTTRGIPSTQWQRKLGGEEAGRRGSWEAGRRGGEEAWGPQLLELLIEVPESFAEQVRFICNRFMSFLAKATEAMSKFKEISCLFLKNSVSLDKL